MKTADTSLPNSPLSVTILFVNPGLLRPPEESVDFRVTSTRPDGSFAFAGLDNSAAGVYRVIVEYKGIRYEPDEYDFTNASGETVKSRAARFANNQTSTTTIVPIYEPAIGRYQADFTVLSHQIIISGIRASYYNVLERLVLKNDTDKALVGALPPDGTTKGVPLTFNAPPTAQNITTIRTDLLPDADLIGQTLTLSTPIEPGLSDVTYSYSLQGDQNGLLYKRTWDYASPKVQVLVSDTGQEISSPVLKEMPPPQTPQGAGRFRQYSFDNAQSGQTIELAIGSSPLPSATTVKSKKNIIDRARDNFSTAVLITLAMICFLLVLLALLMPRAFRRLSHPSSMATSVNQKNAQADDVDMDTAGDRETEHAKEGRAENESKDEIGLPSDRDPP